MSTRSFQARSTGLSQYGTRQRGIARPSSCAIRLLSLQLLYSCFTAALPLLYWTSNEAKLLAHQAAVCALEADKQRLYSGSVDRSVCVWDLRDWSCLQVLVGHSKSVFVLKALGNWLLSGSDDGSIKVWDIRHMHDTE
jgi:WD40 repeat protein